METSNSLIKPFLVGVFRDIRGLHPDDDFSEDGEFLDRLLSSYPEETLVAELSRIGKSLETSLITGLPLDFRAVASILPVKDGSNLPAFLYPLWSILFQESGVPRWRGVWPLPVDKETKELDRVLKQQRALSTMLLRQFFLGFFKLRSLECEVDQEIELADFKRRLQAQPKISCEGEILSTARTLLTNLVVDVEHGELKAPLVQFQEDPFGCHGPGAVFDGSKGRDKWAFDSVPGFSDKIYWSQHAFLK